MCVCVCALLEILDKFICKSVLLIRIRSLVDFHGQENLRNSLLSWPIHLRNQSTGERGHETEEFFSGMGLGFHIFQFGTKNRSLLRLVQFSIS